MPQISPEDVKYTLDTRLTEPNAPVRKRCRKKRNTMKLKRRDIKSIDSLILLKTPLTY